MNGVYYSMPGVGNVPLRYGYLAQQEQQQYLEEQQRQKELEEQQRQKELEEQRQLEEQQRQQYPNIQTDPNFDWIGRYQAFQQQLQNPQFVVPNNNEFVIPINYGQQITPFSYQPTVPINPRPLINVAYPVPIIVQQPTIPNQNVDNNENQF